MNNKSLQILARQFFWGFFVLFFFLGGGVVFFLWLDPDWFNNNILREIINDVNKSLELITKATDLTNLQQAPLLASSHYKRATASSTELTNELQLQTELIFS